MKQIPPQDARAVGRQIPGLDLLHLGEGKSVSDEIGPMNSRNLFFHVSTVSIPGRSGGAAAGTTTVGKMRRTIVTGVFDLRTANATLIVVTTGGPPNGWTTAGYSFDLVGLPWRVSGRTERNACFCRSVAA